jgi:hypothetical protein
LTVFPEAASTLSNSEEGNEKSIPRVLAAENNKPILLEAVYFVVRVLRNAIRGYLRTPVSTEPSKEAQHLAERVVKEIEATEKQRISDLDKDRIVLYINALERFLEDIS